MENRKILKSIEKYYAPVAIILIAAFMRLFPHPPNFAPIGALALFGGAHFKGKQAYVIPLLALFISDIILGFHATMPFVYGSFLLIVLIGQMLRKERYFISIISASIISSLLFFTITNFGVWATSTMYARSLSGLMNAYIMGLPFLRNTLLGDLVYSLTFFYGYSYSITFTRKFILRVSA